MPIIQAMKGLFGYGSSTSSTEEYLPIQPERRERQGSPTMQGQKRDLERPETEEKKRAKVVEQVAKPDVRETLSMRERSSMDSRRREVMRGRAFSASVQDIPSMKPSTPIEAYTTDVSPTDARRKELTRGRTNSVVRREARPVDAPVVDDRSVERPRKRRDTSVARDRQVQELVTHNSALKNQLENVMDSLRDSEKRKIELHKTNNALQEEKVRLIGRESATRRELSAKDRDAKQKIADLQAQNRRQEEEIRILKERIRYAEEKHSQTSNLLQVRTADLRGAETFLTTADKYSGSEIMSMADTLNAEIFQAAAYMAELLEDPTMVVTEEERKRNMNKYVRGVESAHGEIGNGLFAYFLEKGCSVRTDPLPLQLALQTLFCRWCAFMIRNFSIGGFNNELSKLYEKIQSSEPQAVTGRWRAITSTHTKLLDCQTYSDQILDMVLGLLSMCGWSVNSPRSQKAILSMQHMVGGIEKLWIQLKNATKEGITTADIDVFIIDFARPYDDNTMEDNYADASSRLPLLRTPVKRGHVLCTVGMGLRKTVMKRHGGAAEKQVDILLKPKIALESVLEDVGGSPGGSQQWPLTPSRMDGRG